MSSRSSDRPRVGIGVFVFSSTSQRFLLGLRKNSAGHGTWGLPGGHLEHGESFEACAAREVREETGKRVDRLRFLTATNSVLGAEAAAAHYVTVFMGGREEDGEGPRVMEPDKCEEWRWVDWEGIYADGTMELFQPMLDLVKQRQGFHPYEVWDKECRAAEGQSRPGATVS